jgi:iron complex transport system substrate-binding protein
MKKLLSILLLILLLLSGCAANVEEPQVVEETSQVTTYPLSLVDSYDRKVVIENEPLTIVSLSPSFTETMYAIGAEEKLVARTDYCDYPAATSSVQSVGSMTEPNVEMIAELNPDLVVATSIVNQETVEKLQNMQIDVVVLTPEDSVDGVLSFIETVGLIVNNIPAAKDQIAQNEKTIDYVETKVKDLEMKSVYYVVGFGEYGDFTAGGDTFVGDILLKAHANNIASDVQGWNYSFEQIVDKNPEYIILSMNYNTKDTFIITDGYKDLEAVKNGKILEVDENKMNRTGPRVGEAILDIAKLLYPDSF